MHPNFERAVKLYEVLEQEAEIEKVGNPPKEVKIVRGSLVEIFLKTGFNHGHYSPVWNVLHRQNCVSILQRGSTSTESIVALHHPPEQEKFEQSRRGGLTRRPNLDNLMADVEAIKKLVGGIDIRQAFKELNDRVRKLEGETK